MKPVRFAWDRRKDARNVKKHKISFEEAKSVFYDDNARVIHDPDHSEGEERFIILGMSTCFNVLLVAHCYRENESVIRIISARKAGKNEIKSYMEFLK